MNNRQINTLPNTNAMYSRHISGALWQCG